MFDAETTCLIEMQSISKAFGPSAVLKDVTLRLRAGSVHALMGENGAGKSTLMKILAGVHRSDAGRILMNGKPLNLPSPREALAAGISTVFQELSLLPNLTIAENMFLGRELLTSLGGLDRRRMRDETAAALAGLDLQLDPDQLVSTLSIAERQFVEIAHGIKAEARVLILDEPTAALNAADVEVLNRSIRRLKAEGKAIVYISHRMDEIFGICDEVTVLKDGQHIGTKAIGDVTPDGLIAMMVGRALSDLFPPRAKTFGAPVLELTGFRAGLNAQPFDLSLHAGEILGLAGLESQGQQRIMRSLIGRFPLASGKLRLNGHWLHSRGPQGRRVDAGPVGGKQSGHWPACRKAGFRACAGPWGGGQTHDGGAANPGSKPWHSGRRLVRRQPAKGTSGPLSGAQCEVAGDRGADARG